MRDLDNGEINLLVSGLGALLAAYAADRNELTKGRSPNPDAELEGVYGTDFVLKVRALRAKIQNSRPPLVDPAPLTPTQVTEAQARAASWAQYGLTPPS